MNQKAIIQIVLSVTLILLVFSCTEAIDELKLRAGEEKSIPMTIHGSSDLGTHHSIWDFSKNNLSHYCQRKAGPTKLPKYPAGEYSLPEDIASSSCALTCYMMAAHVLAKFEENEFPLNGNKLKTLISQVGIDNKAYTYLANIERKLKQNKLDGNSFLKCELLGTTDRTNMKSFLENSVDRNMLVLVAVKANVSGDIAYDLLNTNRYGNFNSPDPSNNPDMRYGNSSKQYLLTTPTKKDPYKNGHIILITEVDIWGTGNGIISYIDPLSKTKEDGSYWNNRRYVLYSRLLDAMKANGANNTYSALAIGLKNY